MSERFYINCPLQPGMEVELAEAEAHHLAVVCRLRPGAEVCLFNGDGREYLGQVTLAQRRCCRVLIRSLETPLRELGFALEVAAPLPKGDRAQFLIEKCTELRVTRFIPLLTQRGVVQPGATKLDKMQRYVIEASKQCRRNVLMRIEQPQSWPTFCRSSTDQVIKVLAHPGGSNLWQPGQAGGPRPVSLAVGPEGGFTEEEINQALAAGWHWLSLGPRTLRVETAALVLAAWANAGFFNGGMAR